ncbi:sulfotransferase family protein [Endothiovibrio diazotrophicus]
MSANRLLISGIFRSGTTLLTRALDAHSRLRVLYQPFSPLFRAWRNAAFARMGEESGLDPSMPMGWDYLDDPRRERTFLDAARDARLDAAGLAELRAALRRDAERDPEERFQAIEVVLEALAEGPFIDNVGRLFDVIGEHLGSAGVGVKEVWCEEFSPLLIEECGIRIVHILRDPRAVLASRNTGRYLAGCDNMKYPILFVATTWNRSWRYVRRHAGDARYHALRYEDLVTDPEPTLRGVCDHLGIDFEEAMCDPSAYTDGRGRHWAPNSTTTVTRAFNAQPLAYWREALSEEEIGVMEFLCGEGMAALGYDWSGVARDAGVLRRYREERERITEWLNRPPFLLDAERIAAAIEARGGG